MRAPDTRRPRRRRPLDLAALKAAAGNVVAWEQIEEGRYMPRRTRGSFPGRELG